MRLAPALSPPALLILLTACAPAPQEEEEHWQLQTLNGDTIEGGTTMTLGPGDAVAGQAPCNLWWTRNTVAEPGFVLEPIATTRRHCLAEAGEARFLAAMVAVTEAERRGGLLALSGPDTRLVFAPAQPPSDSGPSSSGPPNSGL